MSKWTPFPENEDRATGQYGGFLGLFLRRFPFWVSEWEMDHSNRRKTGLFRAVWIEDQEQEWA